MTFVFIALLVLLLVAVYLLRTVRGQRAHIATLDDLSSQSRAVDVEAFQNLIDSQETAFLRRSLSPAQYRIVQRERTLAAIEYVRNISHNAGLLVSLGQLAMNHSDPQIASAAQMMVSRALHVRTLALFALAKLYPRIVIPGLPFRADDIFRDYRRLTETAVMFTRLQRPAFAGRLGALL